MTQLPGSDFCQILFIMNQPSKNNKNKKDQSNQNQNLKETRPKLQPQNQQKPPQMLPQQEPPPGEEVVRLKSKGRKIAIGLIISLSAVMFGYSIKEITSVPIETLVIEYNISMDKFVAQSILIGILPLAAIIGAIITRVLIKRFKRLSGIYVFTIVNIGAIALVNVNFFYTLLLGRFLEGICVGFYSAIAPIYLKQIAPKQLRKMLGLFFSFGKIVGVLISVFIELIVVQALNLSYAYRIILSVTALLSILQAVLIFFFGSDTPTQHIQKGNKEQAKQIIKRFYHQKYVEEVLEEYTEEYEASQVDVNENEDAPKKKKDRKRKPKDGELKKTYKHGNEAENGQKATSQDQNKTQLESYYESQFDVRGTGEVGVTNSQISQDSMQSIVTQKAHLNFEEKRQKAYCLGVHLAGIRNFIGANAVITQGGLVIKLFNSGLGTYTSLIINLVQFGAVIFGLTYVQTIMGKKPLFLISIPSLVLLNFALAISMIYAQVTAMLMLMCLYMAIYGVGFISPIWAYPSQVIPAAQQLPANILHWISTAFTMLIPPLVSSFMPGNNPWPVFIGFGLYGIIGFIHVRMTLRQSNGLTYKQIVDSFK